MLILMERQREEERREREEGRESSDAMIIDDKYSKGSG